MKKIITLFAIVLVFSSCEKAEVEIPLADQVMGNYTMNSFQTAEGSVALPFTSSTGSQLSARAVVTKLTETTVDLSVITKTTSGGISLSQPATSKGLVLAKSSTGKIEFKNGLDGGVIADVNGTTISVKGVLEGTEFTYVGSKDM